MPRLGFVGARPSANKSPLQHFTLRVSALQRDTKRNVSVPPARFSITNR